MFMLCFNKMSGYFKNSDAYMVVLCEPAAWQESRSHEPAVNMS